ncbi:hypothetical protein D3C79_720630 [compost metagenome]
MRIVEGGERTVAVEHHYQVVDPRLFGKSSPWQHGQGLANTVQGDAMAGGQSLHAADTRDHLQLDPDAKGFNQIKDTQGTVIQRRLTPEQECPALTLRQLGLDQVGIERGPLLVPGLHSTDVVAGSPLSVRIFDLHQTVVRM